jgi:DNA-binding beta-propeller fold protein YncE
VDVKTFIFKDQELFMNIKKYAFFAVLLLCTTLVCGRAEAKELIFHMGYEMLQVIDVDTDEITDIPIKGAARDSAFSADKKFLYVTGSRRNINKIDLEKMQVVDSIKVEEKGWERFITGMALSQDGKTAYVNVFSRRTEKGEAVIGHPEVLQIDLGSGKILRSVEVPFGVSSLCLVENDTKLYALGQDLYSIDVSKKQMAIVDTISMFERGINVLAFWHYTAENDGVWLSPYYTAEGMGLLSIETKSGKVTETMIEGAPPFAYNAIYSPDKTKAYAVMDEVAVIDLKTKTYEKIVIIPEGTCYGVIPTTDGKKLYAGGGGSTITVFDVATMLPIKVLQMETDGMGLRRLTL